MSLIPSSKMWLALIGVNLNRIELNILREVYLIGWISPSPFARKEKEHPYSFYKGCKSLMKMGVLKRVQYPMPEEYKNWTSFSQSNWRKDRGFDRNFQTVMRYGFDVEGINRAIEVQVSKLNEIKSMFRGVNVPVDYSQDRGLWVYNFHNVVMKGIILGGLSEAKIYPKKDPGEIADGLVSHIRDHFCLIEYYREKEETKNV